MTQVTLTLVQFGGILAATLRELANELDRRSLELSIGRDVAEVSRRTQGVSR